MNWYSIFYWLTVADSAKGVFSTMAIILLVASIISVIGLFSSTHNHSEEISGYGSESRDAKAWAIWVKAWKTSFISCFVICAVCTLFSLFIPTKKDSLIIIAGGTVGNFVTQDSSARKIPSEVLLLLRTKIKEEINETSLKEVVGVQTDTLANKSKEQLMEIIKNQK